jgi:hypothetical protein
MRMCSFPPMKYFSRAIGVILMSLVVSAQAYAFNDVTTSNPDAAAIEFLRAQNIISGSEDGMFHPELSLTRCELTKIALKVANITPIPSSSASFSDIPVSSWCHEYAYTARSNGILSGYPDGTFHPNQAVTEIEALKIIINSLEVTLPTVTEDMYLDVRSTDWWAPYIKFVRDNHLSDMPTGGHYGINQTFVRKKMARVVYHGLDLKQPRVASTNSSNSSSSRSSTNGHLISPTSPENTVDSIIDDLNQVDNQLNDLTGLDLPLPNL